MNRAVSCAKSVEGGSEYIEAIYMLQERGEGGGGERELSEHTSLISSQCIPRACCCEALKIYDEKKESQAVHFIL